MKLLSHALFVAACSPLLFSCGANSPKTEPPPEPLVAEAPPAQIRVVQPAMDPPTTPPSPAPADDGWREAFPNIRVNADTKSIQFDGIVPIDAHDQKAPWVFLEVVACTPDTKEHEALVMTKALPSHVHAALLLIGLHPGAPGHWTIDDNNTLRSTPPHGGELRVSLSFLTPDGTTRTLTPEEMIVNAHTGARFPADRAGKWVFAGSRILSRNGRNLYDADGAGTLIGLTTFGSETIAWSEVISPEAAVEEPAWIADARTTPPAGTPITVTISAVDH